MVNTVLDGIITTFPGPFGFPRRTLIVEGKPLDHRGDSSFGPGESVQLMPGVGKGPL